MMKFLKQVKFEITNILRSKFLLVIAIIVLALSVLIPVGTLVLETVRKNNNNDGGGKPIPLMRAYYAKDFGGGDNGQPPIEIDGVTITGDNPYYWNLQGLQQEKAMLETDKSRFTKPETLDVVQALLDAEIQYYLKFAQNITTYQDYRVDLAWNGIDSLYDKFLFERVGTVSEDVFYEAAAYRKGLDNEALKKKYLDPTPPERLDAISKAEDTLTQLFNVVENNDFDAYITLRIGQFQKQIKDFEDNIELLNKNITENPDQEEILNQQIEEMQRQIANIKDNSIPILEYRKLKHIVPGEDVWQNNALSDVENYRNQLMYTKPVAEEEFNQQPGLKQQYGSYQRYLEKIQKQINSYNDIIKIAQNSLDAGKPDMKYVINGSRNRTVGFLYYSSFVALFGVLLGGWLIASEFQQGTVRLLMIRPKTRLKILSAKYVGALAVLLILYLVGMALNFLVNGLCFGFADFGFPNYSINGEIAFIAYYLPRLLACVLPILFGYTVAFMMSVLVRNTAVSIAVPVILYVGCLIVTTMFAFNMNMEWLAYTPIPYVDLSAFYMTNTSIQYAIQNGAVYSVPLGIGYLVGLSAVAMVVSTFVFKKRDITN